MERKQQKHTGVSSYRLVNIRAWGPGLRIKSKLSKDGKGVQLLFVMLGRRANSAVSCIPPSNPFFRGRDRDSGSLSRFAEISQGRGGLSTPTRLIPKPHFFQTSEGVTSRELGAYHFQGHDLAAVEGTAGW